MRKPFLRYSILFLFLFIVIWVLDSLADAAFFYKSKTFRELFISDIPEHEIFFRIILIVAFGAFIISYHYLFRKLKKSNRDLKFSQERYNLLASHVNDVIWTMDMKGKFMYVSPSVERLRGYTPEEVMNSSIDEALTPQSRKVVGDLMIRLTEYLEKNPGRVPSILTELEQTCKDGSSVWTEASVSIIFDESKKPELLIGVSRNISDRKAKQAEVIRSEQNYRLLADNSHDYIFLHDTYGFISYLNPSALIASGYNPDEVIGMRFADLVPGEYKELLDEISEVQTSRTSSKVLHEIEFFNKKGKRIPIEIMTSPVTLNGQIVSVLITARDITERVEARKLFLQNEMRFRSYIENSPIPIISLSLKGLINYVNPSALKYFGYSEVEIGEINFFDIVIKKDRGLCRNNFRNASEQVFSMEITLKDKKSSDLVALVSGGPIDENDLLLYIVDITSRKQAEERAVESETKLRELNANLENLILIRTNELLKANNELESFTSSVSHDLRAPLRHLELFSSLLSANLEKSNTAKVLKNIEDIKTSVNNMKLMINHILEFSKLGRAALHAIQFSMDKLVNEVLGNFEIEKRPELEILKENLGDENGDYHLVKLVWQNLISNAIKFSSGREHPKVKISIESNQGIKWYVIKDNGVGFNPDYAEKLFSPFKRLHSESEFEGTGIGLAFAKTIIEKHEGEIIGESEPGKGARFKFYLNGQ